MHPLSVAFSHIFVASEPTANSAISIPLKSKVSKSLVFRTLSPNDHLSEDLLPLGTAVNWKQALSQYTSISLPTLPVAPK